MNMLEITAVLLVLVLINCVGAFAGVTTKNYAFENAMHALFVCTFVVGAAAVCRVFFAIMQTGPKNIFRSYPRTVDVDSMSKSWKALQEVQLDDDSAATVFSVFTESDRRAFLQFVQAFQNASLHSISMPIPFGQRIFVPSCNMA